MVLPLTRTTEIGKIVESVNEKTVAFNLAVGGSGAIIYGLTLNEWVAIFTIVYMALQIILLLPKYYALIVVLIAKWRAKGLHGE